MSKFLFSLLLVFFLVSFKADSFDSSLSGLFANPDPTQQNTFYNCGDNTCTLQSCPEPLVFLPGATGCDYPINEISSTASCPNPNGLFINADRPSTFYNCVGGVGILQSCPWPLIFNQNIGGCDVDNRIGNGCPRTARRVSQSTVMRDYYDCTKYFYSSFNIKTLGSCPKGMVFMSDAGNNVCVDRSSMDGCHSFCDENPTAFYSDGDNQLITAGFDCLVGNLYQPYPLDVTSGKTFLDCTVGSPVLSYCCGDYHFDFNSSSCVSDI